MPKTWSNRPIDHVEIIPDSEKRMPLVGWILFGAGFIALAVYTTLAVNICLHPVEVEANQNAPITTLAMPHYKPATQ